MIGRSRRTRIRPADSSRQALRGVFARPGAWRVLDAGIAVMVLVLAAGLVRG